LLSDKISILKSLYDLALIHEKLRDVVNGFNIYVDICSKFQLFIFAFKVGGSK